MMAPELFVSVIGCTGGVGSALLAAMARINLQPFAVVNSRTMQFSSDGVTLPVDFGELATRLLATANDAGAVPVIVDVTASSVVSAQYQGWLEAGISVVAANKLAFSGPEPAYRSLATAAAAAPACRLLHETTVGAGLPVIATLKDLAGSSHTITKIEGVMSGTLAFVLARVAGGAAPLSAAVAEAKDLGVCSLQPGFCRGLSFASDVCPSSQWALLCRLCWHPGYTEPDPREDLCGNDVARKALILARVAGCSGVEMESLDIESLVPEQLRECPVDEFMAELSKYDDAFAQRVSETEAKGERLHYAASVDVQGGTVTVGLLGVTAAHPFNNAGPDNMVAFSTNFYERPLVIQGAGAGGDVTATGVLADVLRCANQPLAGL